MDTKKHPLVPWIRFPLLLFFACAGSGCATKTQYGNVVRSWVGTSGRQLVRSWGYPDSQITAPNGNPVYLYQKSRTLNFSQTYANPGYGEAYFNGLGTYTNNQIQKLSCTTWFEIDRTTKEIRKVLYKGDL